MRQQIAVNTQHTGNRKTDHRGFAESWTSEQLDGLLSEDWLRKMVADIRAGNEALKDALPYICPHYSRFNNNHRAQADIVPEAFTFMTCVDVDEPDLVEGAIKRALELNSDEYSDWQDQILRIEYSARRKVHIYIRIPKGMTIGEAQDAFCSEMGIPKANDESCTTPERFIYLTGRDEEVYRSEHWLEALSEDEIAERREAYLQRGLDVDGRKLKMDDVRGKMDDVSQPSDIGHQPSNDRTMFIFKQCMKEAEIEPSYLIDEGARHNSLKAILSVGATQLLTQDELMGVLQVMMPKNWQDQNIRQLVSDFYEKYTDTSQKMTQFQRKVFAQSLRLSEKGTAKGEKSASADTDNATKEPSICDMSSTLTEIYASDQPPRMPEAQPKLIKLLTKNTPEVYKPTVAHAVFPSLGAHLKKVQFQYTDNVMHEATLMNVAMAGTGAGKGCIDEPINRIMADIRKLDEENVKRLNDWNKENNRKGANKDKRERPEDLVIQEIDADVTHAAFVQRMDEAKERFLYFKLNEIELFDKLKGSGGQQFVIMCQAFDPNNRYGQTRAGSQSVNAKVCIRFNWNAAGTIGAVTKYFARVLTKGPISRINFCTIPELEIGAEQPIYGVYDEDFDNQLKPYIRNLCEAQGVIDCPQARRLAKRLIAECAEFSRLSQDRVFENLSFRANVIAYLKACVLYVANGCKWERSIEEFIRWSLHYDLWCKMEYFGEAIRNDEYHGNRQGKPGPVNLLELLPDTFTVEEAMRVRRQHGKDDGNTRKMVSQWKSRGYILQLTVDSFQKSDKFRKGD